ncbi:hypothetical protein V8E51_001319 [Hyaloscypha variabilis]
MLGSSIQHLEKSPPGTKCCLPDSEQCLLCIADIEHHAWVKDAPSLPSAFGYLVGINLKDQLQCTEQVFPHLCYAKGTVDYFLAHIVFPKEMKGFPYKLSASGGCTRVAEDEVDQAQAVVYFNDADELSLLNRKGNIEPLQTSSFVEQLDLCLLFLGEVHTRGTDLRLPAYYRAAVTLGPNLTKDRIVQVGRLLCSGGDQEYSVRFWRERPNILNWAVSETCLDIRRSMPLCAAQGQRFEHQSEIWTEARTERNMLTPKGKLTNLPGGQVSTPF